MPQTPDPLRDAFNRLATPEKVAFVVEATFDTIGQALGETGRRFSDAIKEFDLDALFTAPGSTSDATAEAEPEAPEARPRGSRRRPPEGPTGPSVN